jgi:hypothetical protein
MNPYSLIGRTLTHALPALVGITLLAGVGYVNDQQTWRLMANEPQEWMAQSAANDAALDATSTPGSEHVVIERDEAPYVILYDAKRDAVSGTGYLHGVLPQLPNGVFDAAARTGVNRLTWQPEAGVRQALVILPIKGGNLAGGFAVSGRSLAYTEWQESQLMQRWLLGWLASAFGILLISCALAWLHLRRSILGA